MSAHQFDIGGVHPKGGAATADLADRWCPIAAFAVAPIHTRSPTKTPEGSNAVAAGRR